MNDDAVTYGIGSIVGGIVSYFWETAGFGLFIAVISFFAAIYAYSEAEKNNSNKGLAIAGIIITIISGIFNLSFLWDLKHNVWSYVKSVCNLFKRKFIL